MKYVSQQKMKELKAELLETEGHIEAAADQGDIPTVEYYNEQQRYIKTRIQLLEIYL